MPNAIERFTLSLLTYRGALVEPGLGGSESAGVLLGEDLAVALGMNEYQRLTFDPAFDEGGALRVDYDAPAFEAMGRLVNSMGNTACVRLPGPELRPIDPAREIERGLRLQNGVFRLRDCVRAEAFLFCFLLQYDILADERAGGIVQLWVNPATRSLPRIAPDVDALETADAPAPAGLAALYSEASTLARAAAPDLASARLRGFTESMQRRRERELTRMAQYYQAIDQEIRRKIGRAAKESVRESERQRLQATARAYEARAAELMERYRIEVRIGTAAVLVCAVPVHHLHVDLLRRTRKTEAVFTWNPFDRRIEPRACDACFRAPDSAVLCDDRVHYLCPNCLGPCTSCAKTFCRACHRLCPRCRSAE